MDGAAVHLRGEASMKSDAQAASGLRCVQKFQQQHFVRTRSWACLERDGKRRFTHHRGETVVDVLGILDERGAGAFVHDLRHGAACVEVDFGETIEFRGFGCRKGEFLGFGADDLAGDGPLPGEHFHEMACGGGAVGESGGADHLRIGEIGAMRCAEFSEGCRGETGKGGEDQFHFTSKGSPSSV